MIEAIKTRYNDITFRSRLEARWAVFFDILGIKYFYEYEGFKLDPLPEINFKKFITIFLNKDQLWYLPDFYIPKQEKFPENCYFEVKPTLEALIEDDEKLFRLSYYKNTMVGILMDIPIINEIMYDIHGDSFSIIEGKEITKNFLQKYLHLRSSEVMMEAYYNGEGRKTHYFHFTKCIDCDTYYINGTTGARDGRYCINCGKDLSNYDECGYNEDNRMSTYANNACKELFNAYQLARQYQFSY